MVLAHFPSWFRDRHMEVVMGEMDTDSIGSRVEILNATAEILSKIREVRESLEQLERLVTLEDPVHPSEDWQDVKSAERELEVVRGSLIAIMRRYD